MAVRIYSLAKELNLDSKVLLDLCVKAGVTGKSSGLASMTDEEVAQVKAFIAQGGNRSAPPVKPVVGPPKVTVPPTPIPPPPPPVVAPSPVPPAPPSVPPPVIASAPAPTPAPVAPVEPSFRREDYVPPAGVTSRPPVLSSRVDRSAKSNDGGEGSKRSESKPASRGPVVRMTSLPPTSQVVPPTTAPAEPAPQKPDIKLPIDAIRAGRAGTPLSAHLKKAEEKKLPSAQPTGRGGTPGGARPPRGAPPAAPPVPGEGRDKERRKVGGGKVAAHGDVDLAMGGREARQLSRRKLTPEPGGGKRVSLGDDEGRIRTRLRPRKKHESGATAPRKGKVVVSIPATVRSFSEALGVRAPQVLSKLLSMGKMANINAEIDQEMVEMLAIEFNVEIELKQAINHEAEMLRAIEEREDPPEVLYSRPPIVTFLGHVDHGKTSLLDRIIGTNVVAGESGGITQHIRAYRIEKDGRSIAFVDTPGHEAFTEMRARGANVTDIAVLVVAADDGVMPQTEEAISHAKAANVPIVVALNKVDLPGWDKNHIFQQLATAGLLPTEWGGDTEVVQVSALKGQGIDDLLETLLTIAELHDYKANPGRAAYGTCLEAELHEGRGVVCKVIVQNGTLRVGDVIVCGGAHGRVKAMYDTLQGRITHEEAQPSWPVNLTGLDVAPNAGDHFYVLDDIGRARSIAEKRVHQSRERSLGGGPPSHVTLETLHERLGHSETQTLNLILRADVRGSIEAIQKELTKLAHDEVQVKVLQATVGGVTEADVHLADASDAIIVGFNVVPDEKARQLADQRGVQIRRYDIIYKLTDDLRAALEGMLKPEKRENELGRALVQRTFVISRVGTVAGCRVLSGTIERNGRVRIIRDSRILGDYPMDSLKREKDDAREVREGFECGIKLAGFNDLKEGDILEVYKIEEVARTL